jgi:pyrimidine deaminase RibD-like protein
MKISDFKIHSQKKLDNILLKLCEMIVAGQKKDRDYYGFVGSCILDPDNNKVYSLNHYNDGYTRVHAERAAIEKYEAKYGKVPEGSICITTLSPCSTYHNKMADKREGDSCTDLLNSSNIRKVYCGYVDPAEADTEDYKQKKYHIKETDNESIRKLCKTLEKFSTACI